MFGVNWCVLVQYICVCNCTYREGGDVVTRKVQYSCFGEKSLLDKWKNETSLIHFHQDFNTETFTQSRTASCLHFIWSRMFTQLTSSLTGTSVRLHRLRSISFPLILSFRFNTLLFLLILESLRETHRGVKVKYKRSHEWILLNFNSRCCGYFGAADTRRSLLNVNVWPDPLTCDRRVSTSDERRDDDQCPDF